MIYVAVEDDGVILILPDVLNADGEPTRVRLADAELEDLDIANRLRHAQRITPVPITDVESALRYMDTLA